jgi:hypothetical protein
MKAWPFLISANPFMESQAVVVPDFIMDAKAVREIIRAADNTFTHEAGEAIYYKGFREGVGTIDMVFRVVRDGTSKLLGLSDDAPLLDKVHRPIDVIEGFVLRGEHSGKHFTKEHLDAAHAMVEEPLRRYWQEKSRWETAASQAMDIEPTIGASLRLQFKESPNLQKRLLSQTKPPETGSHSFVQAVKNSSKDPDKRKLMVFCATATVAIGGCYLAYRHFKKKQNEGVADRAR